MPRITINIGHFGSGKTEWTLNEALEAARETSVILVDADVVNPYFRSGHQRTVLEAAGVRIITSAFDGVLPADIFAVFAQKDKRVFIDAGGDPVGATALGALYHRLKDEDVAVRCVMNAARPMTRTPAEVAAMLQEMEGCCRLRVNGLLNNTNLAGETTPQLILDGQTVAEKAGLLAGVPVVGIGGLPGVLDALPQEFRARYAALLRPLTLFNRPLWEKEEHADGANGQMP